MPRFATQAGDLILVTGATGRVGANLCRTLLTRGYRVRAVVLPGDPAVAKLAGLDVEVVEADLRDAQAVAVACAEVDAICHLAALMGPDAGDMSVFDYWHLNVDSTLHVLEGARQNGRLVKFVFSSTDAVYPAVKPCYLPIDEHHPQDPVNLYGLTKVVGERLCRDYLTEFGIPTAVVRYGGVGSPDERANPKPYLLDSYLDRFHNAKLSHNNYLWVSVIEHERPWEFIESVTGGEDTLLALLDEEGRAWLSHPTDVRDAVQGTVLVLESERAVGDAFNILGPSPVASVEAVRYLAERLDRPWRAVKVPFRQAFEVSTAKARTVLGYHPQIDFFRAVDDGLAILRGEDIGVIPAKLFVAR